MSNYTTDLIVFTISAAFAFTTTALISSYTSSNPQISNDADSSYAQTYKK